MLIIFVQNYQSNNVWQQLDLKTSFYLSWLNDCILLTHWGRVTHICVSDLTRIGSDNGLSAPSHYQNQCWNIVNKTLRNKLQWIFSRNSNIFIQENAFESVVCEKMAILSRPQRVKGLVCSLLNTDSIGLFHSIVDGNFRVSMRIKVI